MDKTMTSVDLMALSAPFALQDHEQRQGGRGEWLTYITEEPLLRRLNEVDPCWEIRITQTRVLENTDAPKVVEVFGEMTIKGVTRANVGTDAAKTENAKDDTGKPYRKILAPDENTTKAATTDLLKRCSRSFGVGSYLLGCPRIKAQDERAAQTQFKTWYDQMFDASPKSAASAPRPQAPAQKPAPESEPSEVVRPAPDRADWLLDPTRLNNAKEWLLSNSLTDEDANEALGISDWRQSLLPADKWIAQIEAWIVRQIEDERDPGDPPDEIERGPHPSEVVTPTPETKEARRIPNDADHPTHRNLKHAEIADLKAFVIAISPKAQAMTGQQQDYEAAGVIRKANGAETWSQIEIALDNEAEELAAIRARIQKYVEANHVAPDASGKITKRKLVPPTSEPPGTEPDALKPAVNQ